MKKIIILFTLIVLLFSCTSKEKRAEKLIKQDLFETLFDYSSYEPVKTDKLDSAFSSPQTDSTIYSLASDFKYVFDKCNEVEEKINDELSDMKLWVGSYGYYGLSKYAEAKEKFDEDMELYKYYAHSVDSLREILRIQIRDFKPEFIGYETIHRFRSKNRAGNYTLSDIEYVFDKNIKNIIRRENISDGDAIDELTAKHIIGILKDDEDMNGDSLKNR